eukprot:CAMPEP_0113322492 /NCGR_PEP_ID=MMETSP0010_2-20120614/15649_1 /TAXON_ID=216773 ORGANISM="Corethron hystrix, Strain 308" /NCGR_SAMPLE_ID=MMETSP0010_2 /ASSEMBLY_ACC=CAM_ASM_000155 /LENGTH=74 /DNA_ID=CAMNT_0000181025 /DNA_START=319 /DNA_END=541 /DNA_ORIENTATION=- /assembly_acc=CAM_ASM_000155
MARTPASEKMQEEPDDRHGRYDLGAVNLPRCLDPTDVRQIYRQVKHEDGVDAETDRRQVKMVSRHGRGGVDNEA